MEEQFELNKNVDDKTEHSCKCGNKEDKSCSCRSGGCSCNNNTIQKASSELADLIRNDLNTNL